MTWINFQRSNNHMDDKIKSLEKEMFLRYIYNQLAAIYIPYVLVTNTSTE